MLFTALDLKLAKERYDVLVELLKASRITGWMIEPIAWQNGHLKVAHVMINTPDEDKSRDLQFDPENPDEFRNAMREIANFPFPKGMDTEGTYISNYNSQHLQTTHCNLLCKNSLKIRINLLKKPIHLYITGPELFQSRLQLIRDVMSLMGAERVGHAWEYKNKIVVSVGSVDHRVSKKFLPESEAEFYDIINFLLMNHL